MTVAQHPHPCGSKAAGPAGAATPSSPRKGAMIIGIMGYAGAGKSEVAKILRERHGFVTPHIKAPMAGMLRTLLRHVGHDEATCDRYIDGDLKRAVIPELGVTSTYAQQTLATDWGRRCIRDSLWLDLWCRVVDPALACGGQVALESCRFPDEAAAIRARGGLLVEVRRPGVGPLSSHESESIPVEPDLVIANAGSLQDLADRVARLRILDSSA